MPRWALSTGNSCMREKSPELRQGCRMLPACSPCTVIQAGSARPQLRGELGVLGPCCHSLTGAARGTLSGVARAAPGLQRRSSGSVVPVRCCWPLEIAVSLRF